MKGAAQRASRWLWALRSGGSSGADNNIVNHAAVQYAMRYYSWRCAAESMHPLPLTALRSSLSGTFAASEPVPPQQAHISSASSLPAKRAAPVPGPDASSLQIILKAHERRYIQAASATIRDLVLLNCLPKMTGGLPEAELEGSEDGTLPDVWIPVGDAPIPQRLTKITVLRSPHVDKKSREQFERKVHKRCISVPAVEEHELRWLLDNLKVYEFPGVQIQVNISSRTYIMPNPTVFEGPEDHPVLQQHMAKQQQYFEQAQAQLAAEAQELQHASDQLEAARAVMQAGYQQLRQQLQGSKGYRAWLSSGAPDSSARSSGMTELSASQLQQAMALCEAFRAAVLDLDLASTDVEAKILAEMGKIQLANGQDPVEHLYNVAKAGQLHQQLLSSAKKADVQELCKEFVAVSQAVLYKLLAAWAKKNATAYRRHFALPPEQQVAQLMAGSK